MSITSLGLVDWFQNWLFWFEQQETLSFSQTRPRHSWIQCKLGQIKNQKQDMQELPMNSGVKAAWMSPEALPASCLLWLPVPPSQQASTQRLFSQVWTIPGTFPSLNTKYLLQVVPRVEQSRNRILLFHIVWISILLIATLIPEQGVLAMK